MFGRNENLNGQINVFNAEGICTGFNLNNQTISEVTTIDNGFTGITNQYTLDYHANSKLTASNFVIEGDGSWVEFTAGQELFYFLVFQLRQARISRLY